MKSRTTTLIFLDNKTVKLSLGSSVRTTVDVPAILPLRAPTIFPLRAPVMLPLRLVRAPTIVPPKAVDATLIVRITMHKVDLTQLISFSFYLGLVAEIVLLLADVQVLMSHVNACANKIGQCL